MTARVYFLFVFLLCRVTQTTAACDPTKCVEPYGGCTKNLFRYESCKCNYRYFGTDCKSTKLPLVPAEQAGLPPQLYQTQPACPYARWFPLLPDRTKVWEATMRDNFNTAWKDSGSPEGVKLNDHNYNTLLGQGTTLGFYGANLFIDPKKLPEEHKVGLFAGRGSFPALVRFSDFGADGSLQLGRMAVKIPYSSAWSKEMNLLTTETLDVFPLNDFDDIASFTGDSDAAGNFKNAANGLSGSLRAIPALLREKDQGDLAGKQYYSQLPYLLGDTMAFRYRFVPAKERQAQDKVKRSTDSSRQSLIKKLSKDDLEFILEIQVHSDSSSKDVVRGGASRWNIKFKPVGVLRLKKQDADAEGTSTLLRQGLDNLLENSKVESAAIHKMFQFHPISNPDEHRPVGEVQTYRSGFYAHHAAERYATMNRDISQNRSRFKLPFEDIVKLYDKYIADLATTQAPDTADPSTSIFEMSGDDQIVYSRALNAWEPEAQRIDPPASPAPAPALSGSSVPPQPAASLLSAALVLYCLKLSV